MRTRTSFEAAMDQLGGNSHDLVAENLQLKHGDTPTEIGKILSSYGHGLAIRHCDWQIGNKYINEVAKNSSVPVFNMQCDIYHPFQAMADLMTILEKKKTLEGKKIVMSWAYAKSYSKPISVPQSFLLLLSQFGADLTLAHPKEFKLMPKILQQIKNNSKLVGGNIKITHNMKIRLMKNEDFPKLYEFWKLVNGVTLAKKTTEKEELEMILKLNPDSCFVAEIDKEIIGSVQGTFNGKRGWIYHLAIKPKYQLNGIGTKLIKITEKILAKKGAKIIYLTIAKTNQKALPFYIKNNYAIFNSAITLSKKL